MLQLGATAASSSTDLAPDHPPPPAPRSAAQAEQRFEATPVPHKEHVVLDALADTTYVTHLVTSESAILPEGQWELIFDEAGDGAVATVDAAGNEHVLLLQDVFSKDLYQSGSEFFVRMGKGPAHTTWSLDVAKARYGCGDAKISMRGGGEVRFNVYVLEMPRHCQQRVYWGLKELYSVLKLKSYKGVATKWLHDALPSWHRYVDSLAAHCPSILSKHGNLGSSHLHQPFYEGCLPETSMSTLGLLLILHRMAAFSRERGGLKEQESKTLASNLLHSLMQYAFHGPVCRVEVQLSEQWRCKFPRPKDDLVSFVANVKEGVVDLSQLVAMSVGPQQHALAKEWTKSLSKILKKTEPKLGLVDLLMACTTPSLGSFLATGGIRQ